MTPHPRAWPERRRLLLAFALLPAGCASSPPHRFYRLLLEAPGKAGPGGQVLPPLWELATSLPLPEYLERDTLMVADGDLRLVLLAGDRWAEPLRDSLPRILRHDLATLRGADRVWAAPTPPGVAIDRVLQMSLSALHADVQRHELVLDATWQLLDPHSLLPPLQGRIALQVPLADATASAIVAAHRQALWQLAQRLDGLDGQASAPGGP